MKPLGLLLGLALVACATPAPPAPTAITSTGSAGIRLTEEDLRRLIDESARGSCTTESGAAIDMASVLFLENPSITTRTGEVMRRVEVSGEDLSIVTLDEADGNPTVSYDIGAYAAEVAQIDGTADVTLRLVLVENEVAVYWRQTFLYSAFRQGIFAIEGDEILQWCDGSAGFTSIGHGVEPIRTRTRRPDQPAH